MPTRRRNLAVGGTVILAAFAVDQASKAWIVSKAPRLADGVAVAPGFDLVFGRNPGVTFGFLGSVPWWGLVLLAVAVCVWLIRIMVAASTRTEAFAAGLIVGGALGNVLDRVRFGAVTDFLDFHVGAWHWPAFNFADVAVVSGAALLVLRPLLAGRAAAS